MAAGSPEPPATPCAGPAPLLPLPQAFETCGRITQFCEKHFYFLIQLSGGGCTLLPGIFSFQPMSPPPAERIRG